MRGKMAGTLLFFLSLSLSLLAQSPPQSINYQTLVRNLDGSLLQNQLVSLRIDLHQGSAGGTVIYSETHSLSTDEFGMVNLQIGGGSAVTGTFGTIDWSNGPYFTEVLVDPAGGSNYVSTGAQQIMSVPYALYAATSGSADTDEVDDADADPTNEYVRNFTLLGSSLRLRDDGNTFNVNLAPLVSLVPDTDPTNELQVLSGSNDTIFLSNGGFAVLPADQTDDADADPVNELQVLSGSNDTIFLSDGGFAVLPADQTDDADADPANELQTLTLNGDTLYISDGNYVLLSGLSAADRCADGLANFDETGVDCGGSQCPSCADRCIDGVQNGDETGIDCGGSSCPDCPTCSDGLQNSDETGVDCGGSLCQSCTDRCSDGIQNGDETGIDCGGSSCVGCNDIARCGDGLQNGDETGIDCGGSLCSPCSGISSCSGLPNGQLTDPRDGKVYNTVQIGNQCWKAENLNYGTMIHSNFTGSTHSDMTNNGIAEKYCYGNTVSSCNTYGGLYEWPELMNYALSSTSNPSAVQGLCPPGWHLPSDAEWTQLENYLIANGYNYDGTTSGNKIAKSMASVSGWGISNQLGAVGNNQSSNNSSGFTALPGGYRINHGNFASIGNGSRFWSSSDAGVSYADLRGLIYLNADVVRGNLNRQYGFSCRCVKD